MTKNPNSSSENAPIVVGVGASAGGLEAFQLFLTGLPADHNLVIILVQHLDPDHESLMPELVSAKTKSPVHSVTDRMTIEKGHIYLIPPGYEMEIKGDTLRLKEFETPRGLRRPIDRFFASLASSHGENAIAVVLSGTGSDGTSGAREVKGAGGLVFVQDTTQAKYDGMPQSVLDQGGADIVARAEEIIDIVRDYFSLRVTAEPDFDSDDAFLDRIMRHVRFRTGHDFTNYKRGTLLRRVAVRMSVLNIASHADYLKYLAETKSEADMLFRDLLINVTSFFRDVAHFEAMEKTVIPEIVDSAEDQSDIRVWVAGASTGEEAYSLAILFSEEIERTNKACRVIIFATDIDDSALATARIGQYPDGITDAIPGHYLERYFRAVSGGFEVGPKLREMVRFSRHSFIKDPPFSKLNLVSCRNVMIYFDDLLQELSVRVFHYALKEGGYLFIGPSENPKSMVQYFTEVSARDRIFRRQNGAAKPLHLSTLSGTVMSSDQNSDMSRQSSSGISSDIERVLLRSHLPAHLHADQQNKVIYASENATRFLAVRGGRIDNDLFNFIAPPLETTMRRLSRVDDRAGSTAEREFQGKIGDREERLSLVSERLEDGTILYVIHDQLMLNEAADLQVGGTGESDAYVNQLESELDHAKQTVRTTVEELETSNEELKSSNEEMMSMNEELQSANEELTTINDELQEKLRELAQANIDLENFMTSAQIATIFLDEDLCLRSYTPEALDYFNFTSSDIGRALADLNSHIDQDRVLDLCSDVIEGNIEIEEEFETKSGDAHLRLRFMPYSPDGTERIGAVFTVQDVTDLRKLLTETEEARSLAQQRLNEVEQIYASSPMGLALIDRNMRYVRLNERLAEINNLPIEAQLNRTIREVIPAVADQAEEVINTVLKTGKPVRSDKLYGYIQSDPGNKRVWQNDYLPFYVDNRIEAVSVTVRDITDAERTEQNLRVLMAELEHRVKNMLANVVALVNQAKRETTEGDEVYAKLVDRLRALAKTHALLTSETWDAAVLRDVLVPETLDVYGPERIMLDGPVIAVNSEAALALGMAVHEMATNAVKYGALSTKDGTVDLTWSRINDSRNDRLVITWTEKGGPDVAKPDHSGFGSKLIKSTIESALGGKVRLDWEPDGLVYVFELDYDTVSRERAKPND